MWRYEFVLEDAVEMTRDSIELTAEDLGDRKRKVLEEDHIEEERRDATMSVSRKKEVDRARAKQSATEAARKSKRPTLLKPGEKLGPKK